MTPTNQGSFRLLRLAGIELYVHWSWFLVAYYGINQRMGHYSSPIWNVLEYLALFGVVLMHEFGHALACRQVGGRADRIVLWPLGGVAYVDPPQRPGAMLWSIAAGPLVNVVLLPIFLAIAWLMDRSGLTMSALNVRGLVQAMIYINIGLLIFNLLPIYPLDGGQILRSLLWFVLGRAWSLMVATAIGLLGVVGLVLLALLSRSLWLGVIAVFILLNCWRGLRQAIHLTRLARVPRRTGFACPQCGAAPPTGNVWMCGHCRNPFDTFETQGVCPNCNAVFFTTRCLDCGTNAPLPAWTAPPCNQQPPSP